MVLLLHGVPPAPERSRQGSSWRTFLNHYKEQFLACDFFTVETLTLRTLNALFFVKHRTSHQGIDQQIPMSGAAPLGTGPVRCRHVLGSIIRDYCRDAA